MTKQTQYYYDRFQNELKGIRGGRHFDWLERDTKQELEKRQNEINEGSVYFVDGVAYWKSNNRTVPNDIVVQFLMITDAIDIDKHETAHDIEVTESIREYKEQMKNYVPSEEELYEMRSAFGDGTEVVDVITGKVIKL